MPFKPEFDSILQVDVNQKNTSVSPLSLRERVRGIYLTHPRPHLPKGQNRSPPPGASVHACNDLVGKSK